MNPNPPQFPPPPGYPPPPPGYGQPPFGQPYAPYPPPPPPKNNTVKIVLLIVGGFLLLVFGVGAVVGVIVYKAASGELKEATEVVNRFMQAGVQNDVDSGYGLFAMSARDVIPREKIEELFDRRELFQDFQAVKLDATKGFNINTHNGQTEAEIKGGIHYSSGPNGIFFASLLKENQQWRLISIKINRGE